MFFLQIKSEEIDANVFESCRSILRPRCVNTSCEASLKSGLL